MKLTYPPSFLLKFLSQVRKWSGRVSVCLEILILPVSTIFLLDFRTVPKEWLIFYLGHCILSFLRWLTPSITPFETFLVIEFFHYWFFFFVFFSFCKIGFWLIAYVILFSCLLFNMPCQFPKHNKQQNFTWIGWNILVITIHFNFDSPVTEYYLLYCVLWTLSC